MSQIHKLLSSVHRTYFTAQRAEYSRIPKATCENESILCTSGWEKTPPEAVVDVQKRRWIVFIAADWWPLSIVNGRKQLAESSQSQLWVWSQCDETRHRSGPDDDGRTKEISLDELSLSSRVDVVNLDYRQMYTRRIAEKQTTAASKLGYVSAYRRHLSGMVIRNTFRNHVVILL